MPTWLAEVQLGQLLIVVSVIGGVWATLVRIAPIIRRIDNLIGDFQGEAKRPGYPERPGVMIRLEALERTTSELVKSNTDLTTKVAALTTAVEKKL